MYHGLIGLSTNRCLETPWGYNPNISPKRFCDHEVIVKALKCVYVKCGFIVVACRASLLDPLWASAFNAVGGCLFYPVRMP
jgi:hypothetical protein